MNSNLIQPKSSQLFTFIREFARLNQSPVTSLDSYIKTFWLDHLPREPECSFVAWTEPDESMEDTIVENWLSIERPERPDPPPVAEVLKPWVDISQYHDSSTEVPELLTRILNPRWQEDGMGNEPQFLDLADHGNLKQAWDEFIESEWWPWADVDRQKTRVQECYNELFAMHRTQVYVGDQYEFLLAVGCLYWDARSVGMIKRHLLVLPVKISFDSVNAVVSVRSAGSTPAVQLETDMLALQNRPSTEIEEESEIRCSLLGNNLFHQDAKTLLKAYVQGLDSEGLFIDTLDHVSGMPQKKPCVAFAPALIVRRRTSKNLIAVCDTIIKQLQTDSDDGVPASVRKLVGELGVDDLTLGEDRTEENGKDGTDGEIFFPLPYNDEQRQILNRLSG